MVLSLSAIAIVYFKRMIIDMISGTGLMGVILAGFVTTAAQLFKHNKNVC